MQTKARKITSMTTELRRRIAEATIASKRARLAHHQPALDERGEQRPHAQVHDQLREDQQGQAHQVAHVGLDVADEGQLHPAERASLDHGEQEQRQPRDHRDTDDPTPDEVERRSGHPQAQRLLVERPSQHQGEIGRDRGRGARGR